MLISRDFPAGYGTNVRYSWHITVQQGLYVQLTFVQFDVYENPVKNCENDVVTIIDFDLQDQATEIGT